MKLCHHFLLLCMAVLLWAAISDASPLKKQPQSNDQSVSLARQSNSGAAAAAVDDDEDDDDDDDEEVADIEDVLDDEDDDDDDDDDATGAADDDEDEEDDEGDYLDRFFDDVLGEDDDEDDDDDVSPAAVQQAAVQDDAPIAAQSDNVVETIQADSTAPEVYEDEQQFDQIDNDIGGQTNVKDDIAQEIAAKPAADDDEDDDDEEDEVEELVGEPLDDDDDDDDDEDDDDDDLIGDDVIEARGMKSNKPKSNNKSKLSKKKETQKKSHRPRRSVVDKKSEGAAEKKVHKPSSKLPAASKQTPAVSFIEDESFNYYVDTIFTHLNEILQRDYDPVTVPLARSTNNKVKAKPSHRALPDTETAAAAVKESVDERKAPAATAIKQAQNLLTTIESQLFGLSTLKRVGNVKISRKNPDAAVVDDFTTIKSNFKLGPLTLKVQKTTTRPGQKNYKKVRSATATTAEMLGRINLRVKNGVASLYSIKVQQPKQVKVESDSPGKTRDLVWKRSAAISRVVSDTLKDAVHAVDFENL